MEVGDNGALFVGEGLQPLTNAPRVRRRSRRKVQQPIGHPIHRRDDDRRGLWLLGHEPGHVTNPIGIGQAGPTKFVNTPVL